MDLKLPSPARVLRGHRAQALPRRQRAGVQIRLPPFIYNRTKACSNRGLELLGFPSLTIIVARRSCSENALKKAPFESLMQKVSSRNLSLIPAFWRPVHAEAVAQVLASSPAGTAAAGTHYLQRSLAKRIFSYLLSAK